MKRKIIVLFIAIVMVTTVFFVIEMRKDFPQDIIYNYMEHNRSMIAILNLDDYVVTAQNRSVFKAYSKKSSETFDIGTDVFDADKSNAFMICSKKNTLYYTASDIRGGSAIYSFDLDTYEKKLLSSRNAVTNYASFFGVGDILSIPYPVNDMLSVLMNRGAYITDKNGFHSMRETAEFLKKKDRNNEFFIPNTPEKVAAKSTAVYFINGINELIKFDRKSGNFSKVNDEKVSDFFISENEIFIIPVSDGKLYRLDETTGAKTYIDAPDINNIKIRNDRIFIQDNELNIYKLIDDTVSFAIMGQSESWDTDGEEFYFS